ncbi:DUF4381 domain-containing protein [Idiomarina sp. M1R2S28]|uniref:DUF4381 domain-containing protein n=1 Tax=Idiomarina rhizosphaerae TaxID=2961572 RepID=A0A9X2FV46_9GAMM|nr:DUF4381 domain-containing protein [Idiomarina rhizosphaerae]MCP1339802.1 DUF4381 domain-containing protein [Idiomarina rhizosphaerae]
MQQPSLNNLNDIVEPGAANWWPPSWPTIAIAVALLAGIALFIFWLVRRRQQSRVRKIAIRQLQQNRNISIEELTVILKRTALAYYPRELVAEKHSHQWISFLLTPLSEKEKATYEPLLSEANKNFYGIADKNFNQHYYELARLWLSKDLSKQPGAEDV